MSKVSVRSTLPGLCREDELLLRLSRTSMDVVAAERAQVLMRSGVDWDKLLRRAVQHRVAPLLYPNLAATFPEALPPATLGQWREHVEANAARNLLLVSHLIHVLELFQAHRLPVVPFKGPVLAALVYNGLERRTCGDLDILVAKQDAVRARDILIAHGYEPKEPSGGPWDAAYLRYAYESSLVHADDGVCVDLHWRLTGNAFPFPLRPERIWPRLQPVTLLGTTIHTLQADDLLLYLCVHGAKHFWRHLGWLCDVAELIKRQPQVVSESLIARARMLGSERVLYLGLVLAHCFLDAPLPHAFLQQAQRDSRVAALADEIGQGVFDWTQPPLTRMEELSFKFKMRERFRDRGRQALHWLVHMLRPNKLDRALIALPIAYAGLYYWLRPIRLIRVYGMQPLRQILRIPWILLKTLRP